MNREWVDDIVAGWIAAITDEASLALWANLCKLRLRTLAKPPPNDIAFGGQVVYNGTTYRVDRLLHDRIIGTTPRDVTVTLIHEDDWVPF